jgi:flagellar biosynthetic protein FlhB
MAGGGEDDGQEKSYDATPRKLEQARKDGDVAVSTDAHAAAAYLGLIAAMLAFGAGSAGAFGAALAPFLGSVERLEGRLLGPGGLQVSANMVTTALIAVSPVFLLPMLAVIASAVGQQAVTFAPGKLAPKLSRINPVKTAGNKFGPTGLFEFAKSAVKMTIFAAAAWWWIAGNVESMIRLVAAPAAQIGPALGQAFVSLMSVIAAFACAIAAVDLVWQRFDHARKLRMTHDEVRKESKETDGDPHLKSKRRARAEEIAKNRMLADVPKADVVIVNPTHYAVALKWSRAAGTAPTCVAKGVDEIAAAIRARAAEAGVPVHRDPPAARMLHAQVEVGREVKPEHYKAVAAAIRFADEMRRRAARRHGATSNPAD